MANEFIARNGLIALDNSRITGSLNISGSLSVNNTPAVLGSGTTNRILKLTASSTAGDSLIFDNGTNVLIGTTTTPTPVVGVAFPLTVTSANTTRIRIDSTQATPNSGFGLYANSVQKWSIAMFGATSDFTIYNDALLASAILVKGGSSNVLIGTPTDAGFKLDVNGTGRFSGALITTAGNGIIVGGTSFAFNPSSVRGSLHIAGSDDRVLSFGTNGNQNAYIYSSSSLTQLVSTPELRFAIGGLTRLTISSTNGNVGIGTTSPVAKLTVVGSDTIIGQTSVSARFSDDIHSTLLISHPSSSSATATITGNAQLAFSTGQVGSIAERMRITSGGNVLIGTTTDAGFKFDVNGTGRFTQGVNLATSSGNVGIGTTSPSEKLDVFGRIQARPLSNDGTPGNYWYMIGSITEANNFGVANGIVVESSGNNSYAMTFGTQNSYLTGITEKMRITSAGSIILTHGGGYTTRIEPNNQINTFFNSSGTAMYLNFQGNGGIFAGSSYAVLYAGSDERIKSEIKESEKTLDKVLNLKPRTFRYKERPENLYYGFIAQEVEKIIPEIVRTDDGVNIYGKETIENQKSIESYGLVWASILVKAIQEQQTQIESLKSTLQHNNIL